MTQDATAKTDTNSTQDIQSIEYRYDKLGNVRERINLLSTINRHEKFDYDNLNRLTGVTQLNSDGVTWDSTLSLTYDAFGNIASKGGQAYKYGDCTTVPCIRPHAAVEALKVSGNAPSGGLLGMKLMYDEHGNVVSTTHDRSATSPAGAAGYQRSVRNLYYTFDHKVAMVTRDDRWMAQGGSSFGPDWDRGTSAMGLFDYDMDGSLAFRQVGLIDLTTQPSGVLYPQPKSLAKEGCGNGNGNGGNGQGNGNGNDKPCGRKPPTRADNGQHLGWLLQSDPEYLAALTQMQEADVFRPMKYAPLRRLPKAGGQAKATCPTEAPPAVPLNDRLAWIFGNTEFLINAEPCQQARRRTYGYVTIEQRQVRDGVVAYQSDWSNKPTIYTYTLYDPLGSVDVTVRLDNNALLSPNTTNELRNPRFSSFNAHGEQRAGQARGSWDQNGDGDNTDPGEGALVAWQPLDYFATTRTRTESTWRGYAGHESLNAIGIVHMKGRIYDPTLGRFLQPDPIVEDDLNPQTWNRYTYVRNNPMTFTDPTGYVSHKEAFLAKTAGFREAAATMWGGITVGLTAAADFMAGSDSTEVTPKGAADGSVSKESSKEAEMKALPEPPGDQVSALLKEMSPWDPRYSMLIALNAAGHAAGDMQSTLSSFANSNPYGQPIGENFWTGEVREGAAARDQQRLMIISLGAVGAEVSAARGAQSGARGLMNDLTEGCCCFPAGTPVWTSVGPVPIEQVAVGTLVWARDPETGETKLKPVTDRILTQGKPLYALVIEDANGDRETIEVTDNHPFWVEGQGWIDSAKLEPGMKLTDLDRGVLRVIELQFLGRVEDTYNLTVADYHTYFAGEQKVFVHNCTPCRRVFDDLSVIAKLKGNSDIAPGPRTYAEQLGEAWVNSVSARRFPLDHGGYGLTDGTRTFRLQFKPNDGVWKANFQENVFRPGKIKGTEVRNVHMTITDMDAP